MAWINANVLCGVSRCSQVIYNSYMNFSLRIPLPANAEQHQRLCALQSMFTSACNVLAPMVQQTRIWNRVTLHHLAYKQLREQFPAMGSQMVCNAIYSVSRTCRMVYQHPNSPFNMARLGQNPLPLLRFVDNSPVYFDRHTLSIKNRQLSLFTLDGRVRFELMVTPEAEEMFREKKLRETILSRRRDGSFQLAFRFSDAEDGTDTVIAPDLRSTQKPVPDYVKLESVR